MQVFCYLAAFLLINRLIKSLRFSPLSIKWKTVLTYAQWGLIFIFIALEALRLNSVIQLITGAGVLLAVVLFVKQEADFKSFDAYVYAHYPLIAVTFITAIVKLIFIDFYEDHNNYFDLAIIAALVWAFARWATSRKQVEEFNIITRQKNELDVLVAERTAELTQQKNELQKTLVQLQTTQNQLIQSEKMASLGELTAGIAHEIQNPLNFVNNFSEVSMELVDEMEEELNNGDRDEAIAIAKDIKTNLEKINHHGRRADGIVKGMLQHSRSGSTTKEPTDINKLADEYLRLAYHGLRAKDKSFNAELVTNYSPTLHEVNVLPQEIGRVLLNLFTNAFYSIQQKQKIVGEGYKPTLEVATLVQANNLIIKVTDNGMGIPDHIKEKIMQPFFTTKPTGEGTGLGLSLSYEIIVKGHNGNINLETKENEYTTFIITLPLDV
jgi:two-component system NtrC family sensor kinase